MWTVEKNGAYNYVYDDLIDQASGTSTQTKIIFNGYYNGIIDHAYVFNISLQVQSYINGDTDLMDFVLLPTQNSQSAARTILKGPGASGIRLRIIYTDL